MVRHDTHPVTQTSWASSWTWCLLCFDLNTLQWGRTHVSFHQRFTEPPPELMGCKTAFEGDLTCSWFWVVPVDSGHSFEPPAEHLQAVLHRRKTDIDWRMKAAVWMGGRSFCVLILFSLCCLLIIFGFQIRSRTSSAMVISSTVWTHFVTPAFVFLLT